MGWEAPGRVREGETGDRGDHEDPQAGTLHRGSITFEGLDARRLGVQGAAGRGLIQVPEGRRVFPTLTVHESLQNTAMAFRLCTRACAMVAGQIVLTGTADELRDRSALVASYLGEELTTAAGTESVPLTDLA